MADLRTTRAGRTSGCCILAGSTPRIGANSFSAAIRPMSRIGRRTDVRLGQTRAAIGRSSKPTTDRSRRQLQPAIPRRLHHPDGHVVVQGEDGGRRRIQRQQGVSGLDAGFERIGAVEIIGRVQRNAALGQGVKEALAPDGRRPEQVRAAHQADSPVSEVRQMRRRLGRADPVVGDHHGLRLVQRDRGDAYIGAVEIAQQVDDALILRHRRRHDDAIKALTLDEPSNVFQQGRGVAVARMNDQLQARALQRIQHALLHVHDIGRAGVVVDQADQERAPERQAARLGIGG